MVTAIGSEPSTGTNTFSLPEAATLALSITMYESLDTMWQLSRHIRKRFVDLPGAMTAAFLPVEETITFSVFGMLLPCPHTPDHVLQ